ncbi:spore cortex-lytic enzyme [Paenisporosarcina cavernae]|uniref:Spore cortex-lytic enzyme n=1 Tax=Paenisporosarcina cavernae TaxID=2320858 RepID=A0A385YUX7_9BACL|nr:spore cortex-lytic enzyme [Paenisporosarcina cavernae]AYC29372.1 spore cortex-lytic enzyme [Paenisporosarcina cavernae]
MKKRGLALLLLFFLVGATTPHAFTDQVLERGAYGDDVVELQSRLQYIGYYTSPIDGKFGYNTYWAVRKFQEQFGLPIDGIAGKKTKQKLVSVTKYDQKFVQTQIKKGKKFTHYGQQKKTEQLPPTFSEKDLQLVANAVYGEARGEPFEGQVAVAAVILNRVEHAEFPNSISGVIFQPGAFTAVDDGQIWLEPNEQAKEAVLDALNGWDPTENAIYYFNPETATSKWIWSRPQIKKIGQHIFCM